jgi:hypothetical protein
MTVEEAKEHFAFWAVHPTLQQMVEHYLGFGPKKKRKYSPPPEGYLTGLPGCAPPEMPGAL